MYSKQANYLMQIIEEKILTHSSQESEILKFKKNNKSNSQYFINVFKTSYNVTIQEFFTFEDNKTILINTWQITKYRSKSSKANWTVNINGTIKEYGINLIRIYKTKLQLDMLIDNLTFLLEDNIFNREEKFKEIEDSAKGIKQAKPETNRTTLLSSPNFFVLLITLIALPSMIFGFILNLNEDANNLAAVAHKIEVEYNKAEISNLNNIQNLKNRLFYTIADYNNAIEYNKEMAYFSVLRMIEQMDARSPARKQVYQMIAENIKEAVSFPEITYEFSRLPNHEFQARNFLELNKGTLNKPLSFYTTIIEGSGFPVRVENREADGKGFRISSGYQESREDPFGGETAKPHLAVDIINVSNIAYINESGYIIRDNERPGNVIAVEDGTVIAAYYNETFGWCAEIDHGKTSALTKIYPKAEKWTTFYSHMREKPNLKSGQAIKKGQIIGKIGNTGRSTGPHLHFEIHIFHPKGKISAGKKKFDRINPLKEIKKD
ncbi:MAG: M23 family metallopeptidase [Spirochaetales bacterium]|nr:M23 family metallopeptidase [Spirochaetales bacterium]